MVAIWAVAAVVFLIIEGITAGITSIWFALGALAALVSALFGAPLWLQVIWFIIISGVTLWLTRPLAKKYVNAKSQPTNADRIIGTEGYVTERIDNIAATGAVSIGGKIWTARSITGESIEPGALVLARNIDGVKLIVEAVNNREAAAVQPEG
jgi:membrane protein implicated in regulation of membrane protease activity